MIRQIGFALIALVASVLVFELTQADFLLQNLLFDSVRQRWIWSSGEPITRFLLYDAAKSAYVIFCLGLGASLLWVRRPASIARYERGIRIIFVSLILVPLCVAGLKEATNVACPRDLEQYGGQIAYVGLLDRHAAEGRPVTHQSCFPAGHASGGFALLSLFFLFESTRNRKRAIYVALTIGWVTGAYKIVIGDHFLSHTLVSMLLAWLLINTIALAERKISRRDSTL